MPFRHESKKKDDEAGTKDDEDEKDEKGDVERFKSCQHLYLSSVR